MDAERIGLAMRSFVVLGRAGGVFSLGGEVLFALRSVGDVSQRAPKVGLATPSQFVAGGVSRG